RICIAHAKSFRVHDFVLKHDCDRETRYRVLIDLLLRQFLDFLSSVRHLLGCDLRLLCWRRRRHCKDERCHAGKKDTVNHSYEFIKQLHLGIKATRRRVRTPKAYAKENRRLAYISHGVLWIAVRLRIALFSM